MNEESKIMVLYLRSVSPAWMTKIEMCHNYNNKNMVNTTNKMNNFHHIYLDVMFLLILSLKFLINSCLFPESHLLDCRQRSNQLTDRQCAPGLRFCPQLKSSHEKSDPYRTLVETATSCNELFL